MWQALAQAGASILGSVIGARSQRDANQANEAAQRDFAQHGISWKVADAKAAGLHPLYALGGSGATYTPSAQPVFDGASLGQNLSRAASAFSSSSEQELKAANIEALKAATAKDYAAASAYASEAARNSQVQTPPVAQSFPVSDTPYREGFDAEVYVDGQAPQLVSGVRDPRRGAPANPLGPVDPVYLAPGVKPGFQRYNTAVAGEIILPAGGSMSEAVESMENPAIQAWVVMENLKHYGPGAVAKLKRALGPNFKWWTDPAGAAGDWLNSYRR